MRLTPSLTKMIDEEGNIQLCFEALLAQHRTECCPPHTAQSDEVGVCNVTLRLGRANKPFAYARALHVIDDLNKRAERLKRTIVIKGST
jgi:hypothetical protein